MREKERNEPEEKQPIDMNTDEAIDYIFAPEIAAELRKQAGKNEPPIDEPEPDCV